MGGYWAHKYTEVKINSNNSYIILTDIIPQALKSYYNYTSFNIFKITYLHFCIFCICDPICKSWNNTAGWNAQYQMCVLLEENLATVCNSSLQKLGTISSLSREESKYLYHFVFNFFKAFIIYLCTIVQRGKFSIHNLSVFQWPKYWQFSSTT